MDIKNRFTKFTGRITLKSLIVMLLVSWMSLRLQAQTSTVSGKVMSAEDHLPVAGVSVSIAGTTRGTVTKANGTYSLNAPTDAILVFSFIGMKIQKVQVNRRTVIDIELENENTGIDEVVVVGYGSQKKINLSGAVDAIGSEQIESRPITNISEGLQGAVPNLNIDFTSGEPGKAAQINIRGITSINGGDPLILVDGVPSDSEELNRLSPEDVSSISVLKDASSAAIYGARAAFGVILITTKTGTRKGIAVNYTTNFTWSKPTVLPDKITDPYIYMRLLETSTNNTPWDNVNYSDEAYLWAKQRSEDPSIEAVRINPNDVTSWEYMGNRDWTHYFMDTYTFSQKHHVSVSGQTEKAQYYFSASSDEQNGVLKIAEDDFKRYNIRTKVDFHLNNWLNIGNNTLISLSERSTPSYLSIWDLYNFFPTDMDKNPDGSWANTAVGIMAAKLTSGGTSNDKYDQLQSTFTGQLDFIKDVLKINADYTIRKGNDNYRRNYSKYRIGYGPDDIREEGVNRAHRSAAFDLYTVFNIYGTFQKQLGRHELNAVAGFNQEHNRNEWFMAEKDDVIAASLPTIGLASGEDNVDEDITDWTIRGAFFRLNYIYNNRYIVEFNGRYDGSSKFPSGKRFGVFPSASAAWRVDQERFMESLQNTVSSLKLRTSYGSLGNQAVGPYGYISSMNAYQGGYLIGDEVPQVVSSPGLVSPNYTWEEVSTTNVGLDLGLFENKLNLSFDFYERNTTGMLTLGRDLPDVLGANEPAENAADLKTNGWELSVEYKNMARVMGKPFRFNTRFILSDSWSEITKFDNPTKSLTQYYEGKEFGEIWGLQSDGMFNTQEEIDQLDESSIVPWGALSIVPGWPKYKDLDGNHAIEKGTTVDNPKDLSVIGNILPRYRFGFTLGFDWNGFDFRAFIQGVGKRDYYPQDYLYWGFYQQPYAGGYKHLLDFYRSSDDSEVDLSKHSQSYIDAGLTNANTDAKYPVLQSWLADRNLGERIDQAQGLAIPQTRYLLNASYLRLKNLTIGYTIPSGLTQKLNISNLRIFVSGENLTEWSGIKKFYDPEAINDVTDKINPASSTARGIGSGYAYPFQRRYSIGLNLTF
ncbi:MAG: SusC/RagA family TonB-linked outer membrane protein [Mangrovibacterium sp.]